jgi:ornithine--oxo-acid transaminase
MRALQVVEEEKLAENAERLGRIMREGLTHLQAQTPIIETVRGRGLLNAVVIDQSKTNGHSGIYLCELMKERGLLVTIHPSFPSLNIPDYLLVAAQI